MNLEDFRAQPFAPCIRVKVGPGTSPLDFYEVDQTYWETHKEEFIDWCLNLPDAEGLNWRSLKKYTNNGVWLMHTYRWRITSTSPS